MYMFIRLLVVFVGAQAQVVGGSVSMDWGVCSPTLEARWVGIALDGCKLAPSAFAGPREIVVSDSGLEGHGLG